MQRNDFVFCVVAVPAGWFGAAGGTPAVAAQLAKNAKTPAESSRMVPKRIVERGSSVHKSRRAF